MNKEVIIFGSGKSIRNGEKLGLYDKIKDKEVWSLNYAFKTFPFFPKRQIWNDRSFYRKNIKSLQQLHEKGVLLITSKIKGYCNENIIKIPSTRAMSLANEKTLFTGGNGLVGFFALSLACMEGYENIFLCGFDYGTTTNRDRDTHYYRGRLKSASSGMGNPSIYLKKGSDKPNERIKGYDYYLKYQNCKIYNVSPESNIYQFQKINYLEFFKLIGEK